MKRFAVPAFLFLVLSSFYLLNDYDWQVREEKYAISFSTKMVHGTIGGLKGVVQFDPAHLEGSKFDVTLDVQTLHTGNNLKDKHAKAHDFLDADSYPIIHFVSDTVIRSDSAYQAVGKLTIKNITRELTIPFAFDNTNQLESFKGKFEINRKDFQLEKKGIGEVLEIEVIVPVKKSGR